MAGTWAELGPELVAWRDRLVDAVAALTDDVVVVSHFIAINVVVGAAVGDDRVMHVPVGQLLDHHRRQRRRAAARGRARREAATEVL